MQPEHVARQHPPKWIHAHPVGYFDRETDHPNQIAAEFFVHAVLSPPAPLQEAQSIAEMVRVVTPGGIVATYMWDMVGGGFPLDPILLEMRAMGLAPPRPPQVDASRMDALRGLWIDAGLEGVQTHEIAVTRTFADFSDFWMTSSKSPALGPTLAAMASSDVETLQSRLRPRLSIDSHGRISCGARAHAIKGRRPK